MREVVAGLSLPGTARLVAAFGLSDFERDVVLLCAAAELRPDVRQACAEANGDPLAAYPTPALALASLDDPDWGALTPAATLRKLRLVELVDGLSFATGRLRLPERVLHYLMGHAYADAPVEPVILTELAPSHERLAKTVAADWRRSLAPAVIVGAEALGVAAAAARAAGLTPFSIRASALPEGFVDLWSREALMLSAALVVEADAPDAARELARTARFPLILVAEDDLRVANARSYDVAPPTVEEREATWRSALGPRGAAMNGELRTLAGHFRLSPAEIRQVAEEEELWEGARRKARRALDGLAVRIDARATWDDLVLPAPQTALLRQLVAHVRQRDKVYRAWGFAGGSERGLGVGALFSGASGTGKTLASEVVAGELGLDLYRIDLSGVVSKYIGETEKNLRRIFAAAEGAGAVLLFDEADALFGKRSEVKDSHDRYANIEVAYLLQQMEAYSGLVVLTTNLKNSLDPAFLRRLRFVVPFPFPDLDDRRRIWEGAFPREMPREALDLDRLAALNLAGGSIRNVALNAAFLAAEDDAPVGMAHLARAARGEYAKLERPMAEVDL